MREFWGVVCLKNGDKAYGLVSLIGDWAKVNGDGEDRLPRMYHVGVIDHLEELPAEEAKGCSDYDPAWWVIVDTLGGERLYGELLVQSTEWVEMSSQSAASLPVVRVQVPRHQIGKLTFVRNLETLATLVREEGVCGAGQ